MQAMYIEAVVLRPRPAQGVDLTTARCSTHPYSYEDLDFGMSDCGWECGDGDTHDENDIGGADDA